MVRGGNAECIKLNAEGGRLNAGSPQLYFLTYKILKNLSAQNLYLHQRWAILTVGSCKASLLFYQTQP